MPHFFYAINLFTQNFLIWENYDFLSELLQSFLTNLYILLQFIIHTEQYLLNWEADTCIENTEFWVIHLPNYTKEAFCQCYEWASRVQLF